MIKNALRKVIYRIRANYTTEDLQKKGLKIGSNFKRMRDCSLDPSHCWLIEIGNDVTLAPEVTILCHDTSTKNLLGYTKIGRVTIGNRVFIGTGTIILPNVKIGDDVIIGAGSVVTKNIPNGVVYAGNPARLIMSLDQYINKERERMNTRPVYSSEYTLRNDISEELKVKQKNELMSGIGFVE